MQQVFAGVQLLPLLLPPPLDLLMQQRLCDTQPLSEKGAGRCCFRHPPPVQWRTSGRWKDPLGAQVNVDFRDEADMVQMARLGIALQPIATALFANSPFRDGKPTGYLSWRSHVWTDTVSAAGLPRGLGLRDSAIFPPPRALHSRGLAIVYARPPWKGGLPRPSG